MSLTYLFPCSSFPKLNFAASNHCHQDNERGLMSWQQGTFLEHNPGSKRIEIAPDIRSVRVASHATAVVSPALVTWHIVRALIHSFIHKVDRFREKLCGSGLSSLMTGAQTWRHGQQCVRGCEIFHQVPDWATVCTLKLFTQSQSWSLLRSIKKTNKQISCFLFIKATKTVSRWVGKQDGANNDEMI